MTLGKFPTIGLSEARSLAKARSSAVMMGADPLAEKREARAKASASTKGAAKTVRTVADLAESYLETARRRNRASTCALNEQRIRAHILPALGELDFRNVTRHHIRVLKNEIAAKGHSVLSNRVVKLVSQLFSHAEEALDLELPNPARKIRQEPEASRERVLSDLELRALWGALQDPANAPDHISPTTALCLQFAAATLQRMGEACGATWAEIDLDQRLWVIPGARTKNRRTHVVPLSAAAIDILQRVFVTHGGARSGPVFASRNDRTKPITRHACTRAMARVCFALGIYDAGPHDLRRTGATAITSERIGLPRFYVSALLNHVGEMGGVTKIYDRNNYLKEKRAALEAWGGLLLEIVGDEKRPSNVLPLARA